MIKVLNIAWKDLIVTLRDRGTLILILVTPFALTLIIGFAFSGTGGDGPSLATIPVVIVNKDSGQFGEAVIQVFESDALSELLEPRMMDDLDAARATVDNDETDAVVIIPQGFSESFLPAVSEREPSVVEVYANPTSPISVGVVQSIVSGVINRLAAATAAGEVSVTQLVVNGLITPNEAPTLGPVVGRRAGEQASNTQLVTTVSQTAVSADDAADDGEFDVGAFDWLSYMAPGVAIMFLMFNMMAGARGILEEHAAGTLPRMLTTPTSTVQVLGGKMLGIYLTGLLQVFILILASGLIFGIDWGEPLGVVILVVVLVAAATSWGMLVAAFARTAGQVATIGPAIAVLFAIMAGNLFPRQLLPDFLKTASFITPNAWGLEAFSELTSGGGLNDVITHVLALLAMAIVLFAVGVVTIRTRRQIV